MTRDALNAALSGRYTVDREIGAGGMATVFLAHDVRHARRVALKVLNADLASSWGSERFLREITVTARLEHEGILPLLDSGEAAGMLYYVMPFVEGESLRARMERERMLDVPSAIAIAADVARALDYAHGQGVVHRDIKPENILLRAGRALVADFGIARLSDTAAERLTSTGLAVGTAAYMSPEQATGERHVDARSDIYSLGCVLYEMLVGEPPFTGPNPRAILTKQLSDPVRSARRLRDTIPPAVDAALTRALAREPGDRFGNAAEFARALEGGDTALEMIVPNVRRSRSRAWRLAAIGGGAVVLAAAWLMTSTRSASAAIPSLRVERFTFPGDSGAAYLAATFQQDFLESLTSTQSVRVFLTGATSLQVDYLLAGLTRRTTDSVELSLTLTRARTGELVSSVRVVRPAGRVRDLPTAAAEALLRALGRSVSMAHRKRRPVDSLAYDFYLRARYQADRRTEPALQRSVEFFGQAIAHDSSFAEAWAGLARALWFSYNWRYHLPGTSSDSLLPRMVAASERALDLDSTSAPSWIARSVVVRVMDPTAVRPRIDALTRAIAADSTNADAWFYLGGAFEDSLLPARARDAYLRSIHIDPTHRQALGFLVLHWMWARRNDSAVVWADSTKNIDPVHILIRQSGALVHALRGDWRAAEEGYRVAMRLGAGPDEVHPWTGLVDAAAHRSDRIAVDSLLRRAIAVSDTLHPSIHQAAYLAWGFVAASQPERALNLLERFTPRADAHFQLHLQRDPQLDPLRSNARFTGLLVRGIVSLEKP